MLVRNSKIKPTNDIKQNHHPREKQEGFIDTEAAIEDIENVEKELKTFINCSGMHVLAKDVESVKTG
jgi:hypothetical protein